MTTTNTTETDLTGDLYIMCGQVIPCAGDHDFANMLYIQKYRASIGEDYAWLPIYEVPQTASVVDEFPNGYASVPLVIKTIEDRRTERRWFWNNGKDEFQPKTLHTWFGGVA